MSRSLLVAIGNTYIPPLLKFNKENFDVLLYKPKVGKKNFDSTSPFFNSPLLRDIPLLNRAGVDKADRELETKTLYSKVVFAHLDYLGLNQNGKKERDINFSHVEVNDGTLYSPINTLYPYIFKDILIPSFTFWVCSSNTFNIISCITPPALLRGLVKWNVDIRQTTPDVDIFNNYEIQFWNFLGAMNINIKSI